MINITSTQRSLLYELTHREFERGASHAIASSQRTVPSGLTAKKSYRILISVAVVAVGVVVAICALAAHQGVSAAEIGLMSVFP